MTGKGSSPDIATLHQQWLKTPSFPLFQRNGFYSLPFLQMEPPSPYNSLEAQFPPTPPPLLCDERLSEGEGCSAVALEKVQLEQQ